MDHRTLTTTKRRLRRDILPMGLWKKAKKLGIWNPEDLDFTKDKEDWKKLNDAERDILLRIVSQFQAGEEAVTIDILPLINVIAKEGRIEEELFLTSFLWEEAKHVDFFSRWLEEVPGDTSSHERYMTDAYVKLFYEILPGTLRALNTDPSPAAQVRASTLYNMVIEGMLAETGYHIYYAILQEHDIMPGQLEGIGHLKRDESRHLAYGVFLLSRLIAADDSLWEVFESYMNELLPLGQELISGLLTGEPGTELPFGLKESYFIDYATEQFEKRYARIQKCRGRSLEEIYGAPDLFIEESKAMVLA
ncbi:MAG: R2-like ligand-binding oxidase [Candidatus Hydrogenedentes bacterium]|nr:R2-like ligand-binding oxidase [Candidatus Hydrogenedentota bacterium]